jgi:hypothetical protein
MNNENEIINDYLNPLLGDLMDKSLQHLIIMKDEGLLKEVENKQFLLNFLDEASQYYSSINNIEVLDRIKILKKEIQELI